MVVSELCDKAVGLLQLVAKKSAKNAVEASQIIDGLIRLKGWAYPQLTTDDLVKVVRCEKCQYYKRYKKKGDRKSLPVYMCSKDRIKRAPDFYCAGGSEKC